MIKKTGYVLILLMAILQMFYGIYAYFDPSTFAGVRGTDLIDANDSDWIRIYASRTLFISLIIGLLLFLRSYKALFWAALFGLVMPVTDAWLAFEAEAPMSIILKHVATAVYLIVTAVVVWSIIKNESLRGHHTDSDIY